MPKNVLITGASSGIGRETSVTLAQNGFYVYAGVRTQKDFESLKSEHKNIKPIFLDVLKKEDLNKVFKELKSENVPLHAIINNAGAVIAQPIECINLDDLKYQFELNTIAPIAVMQTFLPLMEKGHIINISSIAATGLFPYISPYCASKRAMDILFNSLSIEIKNKNIKIVSIKPASIKTPIWNKSIEKNCARMDTLPPKFKEKYEKEMIFLAKNAEKNNYKAIPVEKVSKTILKVLRIKNPKSSYCIGFASILAEQACKLPQDFLNTIIKWQLAKKLK